MAVHRRRHRKADDERIGKTGEREESDDPIERGVLTEQFPERQSGEEDELLKRIGSEEFEINLEEIVGGDDLEAEEWNGQKSDEAVYSGGLLGGEEIEPSYSNEGDY